MNKIQRGKVKWFSSERGYGFIAGEDGKDVFVHYKAINASGYRTLSEGDTVEYEVELGQKGLQAKEVAIVK